MNGLISSTQYALAILACVLIFRLLAMMRGRREAVYLVFCCFVAIQVFETTAVVVFGPWLASRVDYRVFWMTCACLLWICSLLTVYCLSKAVLAEYPGVDRFSRILLNIVFPTAVLLGLATIMIGGSAHSAHSSLLQRWVEVAYAIDRALSLSAVVVLLAILAFILWFPVKMSRNLAFFSIGFVVYFSSKTCLDLLLTYPLWNVPHKAIPFVTFAINVVLLSCFAYWIAFINAAGQKAEVRVGHSWRTADQNRLLQQLEALNVSLMRSSERMSP
jgi:multisubunit Na+/H+ antiporter MnhC subunit